MNRSKGKRVGWTEPSFQQCIKAEMKELVPLAAESSRPFSLGLGGSSGEPVLGFLNQVQTNGLRAESCHRGSPT